ncbi:hypothetical protein Bca101_038522 [Brassica carinata]
MNSPTEQNPISHSLRRNRSYFIESCSTNRGNRVAKKIAVQSLMFLMLFQIGHLLEFSLTWNQIRIIGKLKKVKIWRDGDAFRSSRCSKKFQGKDKIKSKP